MTTSDPKTSLLAQCENVENKYHIVFYHTTELDDKDIYHLRNGARVKQPHIGVKVLVPLCDSAERFKQFAYIGFLQKMSIEIAPELKIRCEQPDIRVWMLPRIRNAAGALNLLDRCSSQQEKSFLFKKCQMADSFNVNSANMLLQAHSCSITESGLDMFLNDFKEKYFMAAMQDLLQHGYKMSAEGGLDLQFPLTNNDKTTMAEQMTQHMDMVIEHFAGISTKLRDYFQDCDLNNQYLDHIMDCYKTHGYWRLQEKLEKNSCSIKRAKI